MVAPGHRQQQFGREEGGFFGGGGLCHRLWPFFVLADLCHGLWHKCQIGIFPVKRQHPLDVALGETLLFRQLVVQVAGKARNHCRAPALQPLAAVDHRADIPIEADHLGIHRQPGPRLGMADALLDIGKQIGVQRGRRRLVAHTRASRSMGIGRFSKRACCSISASNSFMWTSRHLAVSWPEKAL